jgi:signal transduction histidine kinase
MIQDEHVNILLVDDQPGKLLTYETILQELGERVLSASSAREAFQHLLQNDIAVVLVDVCMPDLDGFELAEMIRNHPRFRSTAVIFVSAIALSDLDRVKGYEYGAVDYVPVPIVPELLRAKVRVFAELYRKTRQLERLNAELEHRVEERTAELALANAALEHRVEERTREREMALAQVHEMQKLESLGQLTGGLAHDFNNVLMAILGNLDLVAKYLPEGMAAKSLVGAAIKAAERGAMLTQRMLAFARRQELQPKAVDIPSLVRSMVDMLQRTLGPSIEISLDFEDGLSRARVDPNQLELAMLNLALNARDAMPEGGRLTLAGHRRSVDAWSVLGLLAGDYVCVSVSDTGVGMDETTVRRAHEPFFTTKGAGKGTGLGLPTVYGLAAQSGGTTRISSRLGVGTRVEIWLPAVGADEALLPEVAPQSIARAQAFMPSCAILLVDDDPLVSDGTAAMLRDLGHLVVTAPSAAHALDIIASGARIDLVITDHAMPGMTGAELAAHIRKARPGLPIVLATGYADLPSGNISGLSRLDKPFRQSNLGSLIASLVGDPQTADGAA